MDLRIAKLYLSSSVHPLAISRLPSLGGSESRLILITSPPLHSDSSSARPQAGRSRLLSQVKLRGVVVPGPLAGIHDQFATSTSSFLQLNRLGCRLQTHRCLTASCPTHRRLCSFYGAREGDGTAGELGGGCEVQPNRGANTSKQQREETPDDAPLIFFSSPHLVSSLPSTHRWPIDADHHFTIGTPPTPTPATHSTASSRQLLARHLIALPSPGHHPRSPPDNQYTSYFTHQHLERRDKHLFLSYHPYTVHQTQARRSFAAPPSRNRNTIQTVKLLGQPARRRPRRRP